MAPIQTHRAHCGACASLMILHVDYRGCYFVCYECGVETPPRLTIVEADLDVVWVPIDRHCEGSQHRSNP